jgi:uncharacterized repeat protein (TIGR01451 family)
MKTKLLKLGVCVALISCFVQHAVAQISFISIPLIAKAIRYDGKRDKIYATVNSLDTAHGNTLVQINPHTGAIENSVFIGSNPNVMALTKDNNYVYVGCDGVSFVKRVDLSTFTVDRTINLGSSTFGALTAGDLATSYQSPDMVIVVRKNAGISPGFASVVAYKGTTLLPGQITNTQASCNVIQSANDTTFVYGSQNESSDGQFVVMKADTVAGITFVSTTHNMYMGMHIKLENHLIYSDAGNIVDPTGSAPAFIGTLLGLGTGSAVAPDAAHNHVYFAAPQFTGSASGNDLLIRRYNLQTQTFIDETDIPAIPTDFQLAEVLDVIRYGERGMGVIINQDYVFSQARVVLFESCLVEPGTDVSVQMLQSPAKTYVNDTATIKVIVKNNGSLTADNVITTDTLSNTFNILGSTAANGFINITNGAFTWTLDSLTSGQADTAYLTIAFTQVGVFPNTLTSATNTFDCGLGNNTLVSNFDIRDTGCFHMNVDLSANDTFYYVHTQATLNWHITNPGTVTGRGIVMTDTFSNGVLYNTGGYASKGNLTQNGNVAVYTLDTLAAGESVDVNVVVYFENSGHFLDKVHLLIANNILCDSNAVYSFTYKSGDDPTSVNEIHNLNTWEIYPNPVTNKLMLNFQYSGNKQQLLMEVKDIVGKTVLKQLNNIHSGANAEIIDVSRLPKGIYILQFNIGNENQYFKFIKE